MKLIMSGISLLYAKSLLPRRHEGHEGFEKKFRNFVLFVSFVVSHSIRPYFENP